MYAIESTELRVLSLGLTEPERLLLQELTTQNSGEFVVVETDIDLWNTARDKHFDLCILGQSEALPYPTMRIWLMRALQPQANIIVLYDDIGTVEIDPLTNCNEVELIQRPADLRILQTLIPQVNSSGDSYYRSSILGTAIELLSE